MKIEQEKKKQIKKEEEEKEKEKKTSGEKGGMERELQIDHPDWMIYCIVYHIKIIILVNLYTFFNSKLIQNCLS